MRPQDVKGDEKHFSRLSFLSKHNPLKSIISEYVNIECEAFDAKFIHHVSHDTTSKLNIFLESKKVRKCPQNSFRTKRNNGKQ